MKKNIVWLASYPKSGNTWCRIFLSNYLNKTNEPANINKLDIGAIFSSRSIIEENTGYDISELTANECDELRSFAFSKWSENYGDNAFLKTHDAYLALPNGENMFPVESTKAAICFVRNPLDVAVSFANHMATTPEKTVDKMSDSDFCLAASTKKYNQQVRQRLLTWSGHINSWTLQKDFPVLTVRYEDMLENPSREFLSILDFLKMPIDLDKLTKAINNSSFETIKKIEKEIGFKEKPAKCETFFKVGKSGYYKNILSEGSIKKIINDQTDCMKNIIIFQNQGN
jgi:hypothetical protein